MLILLMVMIYVLKKKLVGPKITEEQAITCKLLVGVVLANTAFHMLNAFIKYLI